MYFSVELAEDKKAFELTLLEMTEIVLGTKYFSLK